MQPYFFPYLGYFQLFHAADKVILYDNVNFIKSGWIHRNRILEIGKGPRYIGLPLEQASLKGRIRDARVDARKDWKTPIMNHLKHNYSRCEHFKYVNPLIDAALDARERRVSEIAKSSIRTMLEYLGCRTPVEYDSTRFDVLEAELERRFAGAGTVGGPAVDKRRRMEARVAGLCGAEGAGIYINPMGGVDLYRKEDFLKLDIQLKFLFPRLQPYRQDAPEFFPSLSIIDAAMNVDRESLGRILSDYGLN